MHITKTQSKGYQEEIKQKAVNNHSSSLYPLLAAHLYGIGFSLPLSILHV